MQCPRCATGQPAGWCPAPLRGRPASFLGIMPLSDYQRAKKRPVGGRAGLQSVQILPSLGAVFACSVEEQTGACALHECIAPRIGFAGTQPLNAALSTELVTRAGCRLHLRSMSALRVAEQATQRRRPRDGGACAQLCTEGADTSRLWLRHTAGAGARRCRRGTWTDSVWLSITLLCRRVVTCTKAGSQLRQIEAAVLAAVHPLARAADMGLRTWTWAAALLLAAAAAAQTAQQQGSQEGLPGSGSGVSGALLAPWRR